MTSHSTSTHTKMKSLTNEREVQSMGHDSTHDGECVNQVITDSEPMNDHSDRKPRKRMEDKLERTSRKTFRTAERNRDSERKDEE